MTWRRCLGSRRASPHFSSPTPAGIEGDSQGKLVDQAVGMVAERFRALVAGEGAGDVAADHRSWRRNEQREEGRGRGRLPRAR